MNQFQSARRLWFAALPIALIVAMAFPISAAAATISESYAITGFEYFATSTQGRFAGTARGSSGDRAAWNAVVNHTPLTTTATITGGYADLATSNRVRLHGLFSGGTVSQTSGFEGCTNQTYDVDGTLREVTRSDSTRKGTGSFSATLTHYRTSVFGRCVVYSASVEGTITLSF
jgi:hypothetical protein